MAGSSSLGQLVNLLGLGWWKDKRSTILDVVVSIMLMTLSFTEHSEEGEPARFDLTETEEAEGV